VTGRLPELELVDAIRAAQQHAQALIGVLAGGAEHLRPRAHVSADVLAQIEHVAAVQRAADDPVVRYTRDLHRDLAYARDLAAALAGRLPAAYALVASLVASLDRDLELAADLGGDPALARTLLCRLNTDRSHARALVTDFLDLRGHAKSADRHREPGALCRHLVAGAVRVLPAAHQDRYAREYAAELWELGAQRGPRRRRFTYALRLGASCWALRRALTAQRQEV
jgi:hypothetical protein